MLKLLQLTIIFQAVGYSFQFIAFLLFARMLGAENQGILSVFITVAQIIALLIWLGLPGGIVYFVGKDRKLLSPVLKNCIKLFIIAYPLLVLFSYVIPLDKLTKDALIGNYISYLLIFVFFLSFLNIFQMAILGLKKYLFYNLFGFCSGIIIFLFSLTGWFLPDVFRNIHFAILAFLITYGIMFSYGGLVVFRESRMLEKGGTKASFAEQFMVGFRGFISNIAGSLLFRVDLFLVGYFLSLREVGIYSIALFMAEMITKIPGWSATILTPMVASNENGYIRRTLFLFYSAIIAASLLGMFVLLVILSFSDLISLLLRKEFIGAETCLLLLLPRVIMQSGVGILAANLAGKGYPWYHALGCIVPLLMLIVIDILFIPLYGINGAALGNSLAYISSIIIFWIGFRKYNAVNDSVDFKGYIVAVRKHLEAVTAYCRMPHN